MDTAEETKCQALDAIHTDLELQNSTFDTETEQADYEKHRVLPKQLFICLSRSSSLLPVSIVY